MPSKKIVDAKVTNINGNLSVSWQYDDDTWSTPCHYTISDTITSSTVALLAWCQDQKDKYNAGKSQEDQIASLVVAPEVTALINTPLNLT